MLEECLMSFQVRSEAGAWVNSPVAKISPMRADAKNPVVAAAQMTCLVRGDQDVTAILWPNRRRRGKVTTRLVLDCGLSVEVMCATPLRRRDVM